MAERIASQHVGINSPRWDEIFDIFCFLYQHHTVQDLVQILATEHGFKTTKSICDRKISQWQKREDGHRLPMKYEKTRRKVVAEENPRQEEAHFPDRSTAPSMTSASNLLLSTELLNHRTYAKAFPLDDPHVPLPPIQGLFGDAVNTSYFDNISTGIQEPDGPAKILRKRSSNGRSSKRTTDFVSHSIIDWKTHVDSVTNHSLNLEISTASTVDQGKPRVTNMTTQRICLSYNQEWEWLKCESGITGDAPEARTFALVCRIEEAIKGFKRDENFKTPLSSLLKQIPPVELLYISEYLWIECPNEKVETDDIVSRVADIKKDIEVQRWFEQWPSESNLDPSTSNDVLDWIDWPVCSEPLEFGGNRNFSNISTTRNSETIDYNKHVCQHVTKLLDIREVIWSNIESTCSSTFSITKSELENVQRLVQQLEATYQYEPHDQQSCQILHTIWTTLNDQLKESALGTVMGTQDRPSWNYVDNTPPQNCVVACCCCGAGPYWIEIHIGCIGAPCNHRFCPHCIYERARMNR